MYARKVTFNIKAPDHTDFTHTFENHVMPVLHKQKGFKEEITLCSPGKPEAVSISLWENQSNADDYNIRAYPEVLKTLARVIEGTPRVQTYETVVSTFHNVLTNV